MFKNALFFVVLAVAGCAFAESELSETDQEFIEDIKDGFERYSQKYPEAKWLGSGCVDIIHIDVQHPNISYELGPEGNLEMKGSTPTLKSLIKLRASAEVESSQTTAWVAWVNKIGHLNLVVNQPLEKSEMEAIMAPYLNLEFSLDVCWVADVKNTLGPNRFSDAWLVGVSEKLITQIIMGKVKQGEEELAFNLAQKALQDLRVLKF